MPPISPADGPVAVTGANGFIGAQIVLNLVEHGYDEIWQFRIAALLEGTPLDNMCTWIIHTTLTYLKMLMAVRV